MVAAASNAALTISCSGTGPRLVTSDTTPTSGDESGTVIRAPGTPPARPSRSCSTGGRSGPPTPTHEGTFVVEYFPERSDCGRTVQVIARGQPPPARRSARKGR